MIRNGLLRLMPAPGGGQHQRLPGLNAIATRDYNPAERVPLTDQQKKSYPQVEQEFTDEGFPILKLLSTRKFAFDKKPPPKERVSRRSYKLRETSMSENQDWPSVWPTAKTFSPSAVPLPLRQSFEPKLGEPSRFKYANTELVKIPNFLHLTPAAVKRHCMAIRKFCTKWPNNLDTDEEVRQHFPVTFITRNYVHASPTIRDPRARVVELKVHVSDLKLNARDEQKLIELARHRYDPETKILTITADACPSRVQNKDYSEYLLSAVYFESQEHQEWENERFDETAIYKIDLNEYRKEVEKKLGLS